MVKLFYTFFRIESSIIVIISICYVFYGIVIMIKPKFQEFGGIDLAVIVIVPILAICNSVVVMVVRFTVTCIANAILVTVDESACCS